MAKPILRNRKPEDKLNLLNVKDGCYLDELTYGTIFPMKEQEAKVGGKEYVYSGKIRRGACAFLLGEGLKEKVPDIDGYNHGYTLEGIADEIFDVKDALDIYSSSEHRTFCYTNADSKLIFVGSPDKEYNLYVRFYDKDANGSNHRWCVIYAEEAE